MILVEDISLDHITSMIKIQVERDSLWLSRNNILMFPVGIWDIVVGYYSDDPRIVDLIYQDQEELFTVTGEVLEDGQMPDGFMIKRTRFSQFDRLELYVKFSGGIWLAKNIIVFQTLLLLPIYPEYDYYRGSELTHLPLIRDYLYYRLAHPEYPVNEVTEEAL